MAQSDEQRYREWLREQNVTDADSQESFYDYRRAFMAGAKRDPVSGRFPSDFKLKGHPNEVAGGFSTITGERVPGTPRADEHELIRLGWEPSAARRLAAMPEPQGDQYLSTDPNAGEYLSFDPNAAETPARKPAAPLMTFAADTSRLNLRDPEQRRALTNLLPVAAGAAAAPFTGGMSIPAAMLTTGGAGAVGSLVRNWLDGSPASLGQAATSGAAEGATQGAGRLLQAAKGPLQAAGRGLWRFAAGGGSKKTAEAVLSRGAGTLTKGNLTKLATPRSPTGAFVPREVSDTVLDTMKQGVQHAGQGMGFYPMRETAAASLGALSGGPNAAVLAGLLAAGSRPLPASAIAQGLYRTGPARAGVGREAPNAIRAARTGAAIGVGEEENTEAVLAELRARGLHELLSSR